MNFQDKAARRLGLRPSQSTIRGRCIERWAWSLFCAKAAPANRPRRVTVSTNTRGFSAAATGEHDNANKSKIITFFKGVLLMGKRRWIDIGHLLLDLAAM